jgi:hypothetical protein
MTPLNSRLHAALAARYRERNCNGSLAGYGCIRRGADVRFPVVIWDYWPATVTQDLHYMNSACASVNGGDASCRHE